MERDIYLSNQISHQIDIDVDYNCDINDLTFINGETKLIFDLSELL